MKRILSILIIIALSTILALGYNASTNLALRLLEATDDVRPFREDFNYNFELVDDIFDDVSLAELAYLDGVTSAIQTQLNAKQTLDAQLTDIAGLTPTDSYFIVGDGTNFITESGATTRTSLGIDLSLYYLKTEIDALSEWETIWSKDVLDTTELNTFSKLQALVADKTLVNEEDVFTIDANWVNTTNPWADNEVDDNITIDLATLATTITVTDNESTAENNPICFVAGAAQAGGSLGIETDGTCYYTPSTGVITTTGFAGALTGNVTGNASGSSGSCTGLAATATALATGRNIGGVSFDGTGAITPIYLSLDHALGTDEDYVGITDTVTVGYTTAIGDLMYFDWTATEWLEAQADAVGTTPALRIALEVKSDGQECLALVHGYIRDDDAFNFGAARIFLNDDTAGLCDDEAPAESGDQIQVVGIGITADILYFCPSIDVGEI